MKHKQKDMLKDYHSTLEQFFLAIYGKNEMKKQMLSYTEISTL
jgi:hypothetical protein